MRFIFFLCRLTLPRNNEQKDLQSLLFAVALKNLFFLSSLSMANERETMKRRNHKNRNFIVRGNSMGCAINNGSGASRVDSIKSLIMFYCIVFIVNVKMSESLKKTFKKRRKENTVEILLT